MPLVCRGRGVLFAGERTVTEQMGKLRWRCRRGMKELDLLTLGYLERHYPRATPEEQRAFEELLELQDPVLMAYMVGRDAPADATAARVVKTMRALMDNSVDF